MSERTEGRVCPPDHKHGETLTCRYTHKCSCADCLIAARDYGYWRRHMLAAGRTDVFDSLIPARGVRRRIEALMAIGWSQSALAAHVGHRQVVITQWLRNEFVQRSTHIRVAEVYERLSVMTPPTDTKSQRMSVNRTLALARRRGYAPPLAWDDIDNDHGPAETTGEDVVDDVAVALAISGQRVTLTVRERHIVVRELNARGMNDGRIAEHTGVDVRTIGRDRKLLGIEPAEPEYKIHLISHAEAARIPGQTRAFAA